ncbi:MAG: S-methyl-5'-thioadenosine phosphorylase [Candidatus ainarchaeum sp.]|nr:S-methyl-5'-thioadenosine phosphorylase [Candidatus ainarchaeum sp.]
MIGIIGGSGLEDPRIIADFEEKEIDTPFGKPSDKIVLGKIEKIDVAIVSRHGKKHSINPTNVPYKANIWALKQLGCTHILASTACGSLREKIKPGSIVFPDQFIDWTKKRGYTFFDSEKVMHIPMADPFCPDLRKILAKTAKELKLRFHPKGTIITIEGPRFSTRAESKMFRMLGADIINMSTVPEVILARELGMCYQTIAMATDYDCFMENEKTVDIETVLKTMAKNSENVKKILMKTIPAIPPKRNCICEEHAKKAQI